MADANRTTSCGAASFKKSASECACAGAMTEELLVIKKLSTNSSTPHNSFADTTATGDVQLEGGKASQTERRHVVK